MPEDFGHDAAVHHDPARLCWIELPLCSAADLWIAPGVPHVFQAYYPILDEAAAALDRAGQLLSAYLASAERFTA